MYNKIIVLMVERQNNVFQIGDDLLTMFLNNDNNRRQYDENSFDVDEPSRDDLHFGFSQQPYNPFEQII